MNPICRPFIILQLAALISCLLYYWMRAFIWMTTYSIAAVKSYWTLRHKTTRCESQRIRSMLISCACIFINNLQRTFRDRLKCVYHFVATIWGINLSKSSVATYCNSSVDEGRIRKVPLYFLSNSNPNVGYTSRVIRRTLILGMTFVSSIVKRRRIDVEMQ